MGLENFPCGIHTPAKQIMMFCASNFLCFAFPVTFAKRSESADRVEKESTTLTTTTRSFRFSIANASLPMMTKIDEDPGEREEFSLPI
jgi:hypothetical protein